MYEYSQIYEKKTELAISEYKKKLDKGEKIYFKKSWSPKAISRPSPKVLSLSKETKNKTVVKEKISPVKIKVSTPLKRISPKKLNSRSTMFS